MDEFHPAFWAVYVFMAIFLGFLAWEIIKMLIMIITGKYTKGPKAGKHAKKK